MKNRKKQKFLPCLHSFCQSCLTQVKQFDRIKCPICRKEVHISSGDVSSLPDTYFGLLNEMERKMKGIELQAWNQTHKIEELKRQKEKISEEMKRKMKEIELKAWNQTRKMEQLKQEKEKMSEEMKRKIAERDEMINQFRCSNSRLVNETNELKQEKQSMEKAIATIKDQQSHSSKMNELKREKQSTLDYIEYLMQTCDNAIDNEYIEQQCRALEDIEEQLTELSKRV